MTELILFDWWHRTRTVIPRATRSPTRCVLRRARGGTGHNSENPSAADPCTTPAVLEQSIDGNFVRRLMRGREHARAQKEGLSQASHRKISMSLVMSLQTQLPNALQLLTENSDCDQLVFAGFVRKVELKKGWPLLKLL